MRQVMVDPYTLQVKGERDWGRFGLTRPLLMSGMFHLHRYLLSGEVGKTITGISGVMLLLMALSGIYLWWPRLQWTAIKRALTVSHGGSWPRFNYTLHKAAGFFAAPVLAVLAFSGIYFNLPQLVVPLVELVSTVPDKAKLKNLQQDGDLLDAGQAMAAAQQLYPQARVSRIVLPAEARTSRTTCACASLAKSPRATAPRASLWTRAAACPCAYAIPCGRRPATSSWAGNSPCIRARRLAWPGAVLLPPSA